MKIVNKTEYPLLKREQLIIEAEHVKEKTPKLDEVLDKVAGILKVKKELIKIKVIDTEFGNAKSRIIANVYKDEETMKRIEEVRKKKKKEGDKEQPQGEKKEAEEKKEALKVEEKKEDGKEEGKK